MSWPKARLAACAAAFVAWSAWLGWQVCATGTPKLVSEPQLLAAPLVVVAEMGAVPGEASVRAALKGAGFVPADQKLRIVDWAEAASSAGPGVYLLPLQPIDREQGRFRLVPIPVSPGHYYADAKEIERKVYPLTPSVELQARQILQVAPKP